MTDLRALRRNERRIMNENVALRNHVKHFLLAIAERPVHTPEPGRGRRADGERPSLDNVYYRRRRVSTGVCIVSCQF
jgi:hypothetical protein